MNTSENETPAVAHRNVALITFLFVTAAPLLAQAADGAQPARRTLIDQIGQTNFVWIFVLVVGLMALIVSLFVYFGRRLSTGSFLGPLARDAIYRAEFAREEANLRGDLQAGRFAANLDLDGEQFRKRFRVPVPAVAPDLEQEFPLIDVAGQIMPPHQTSSDPWTDPWGETSGSGLGVPDHQEREELRPLSAQDLWARRTEAEVAKAARPFQQLNDEITRRFRYGNWKLQVEAYLEERRAAQRRARNRADVLLPSIDVSAFGGSWVFVLEFTAIIVIVFAVLSLGLGGVLESEAIGTILAAIAGYVLGKSTTTRGREGEQVQRGAESPKELLDLLGKQFQTRATWEEERRTLESEVVQLRSIVASQARDQRTGGESGKT